MVPSALLYSVVLEYSRYVVLYQIGQVLRTNKVRIEAQKPCSGFVHECCGESG